MWIWHRKKKNSKKVLFAWKKPPKTRFLTSSSKQIIIIIKQTVSITKLVNLVMRAPSPLIFTLTGLLTDSSLSSACQLRECLQVIFVFMFVSRKKQKWTALFWSKCVVTREFSLLVRDSLKKILWKKFEHLALVHWLVLQCSCYWGCLGTA